MNGQARLMSAGEAFHHGSHQWLLSVTHGPVPADGNLDAIVVPTMRPPAQLAAAAWLARALGCPLVTLHSGELTTASWAWQHLRTSVDLIAIDVRAADRLHLPHWQTSRLLDPAFARRSDASAKRNLALMLSHLLGWARVLFLDDDISGLNPSDIQRACGLLNSHNAVGLRVTGFPDHSVVCHAYRRAGGRQRPFIGVGALVVAAQRCGSFFPDIYNDDWFFMLGPEGRLQPVAVTGHVHQQPHDPFRPAERAVDQELGDVLGEGLYWLLDQGESIFRAGLRHWESFLSRRRHFIERVLEMTRNQSLDNQDMACRIIALRAALGRLEQIEPALCVDYVQAWQADRERWREHLHQLPSAVTRQRGLELLSRPDTPQLNWYAHAEPDGYREPPASYPVLSA